jgi:glycosyltransferase involved in cell wall biosynthesis
MKYDVAIFCPDQHMLYDIHTLNLQGAGGGITARVRIAHALAAQGHSVSLYINCPVEKTIEGVDYHHWSNLKKINTDIFIVSTSGGGMDLAYLEQVEIKARLKILFVHGVPQPKGLKYYAYDFIYAPSNFILNTITNDWESKRNRIFVTHHGVEDQFFNGKGVRSLQRDPYAILYAGHPSKGLETAISILQILQKRDQKYTLNVYGGNQLWGESERLPAEIPGLRYRGLVGQQELVQKIQECGFSLGLQTREEPFGMVMTESMRAGCIVLASPVGAYPEIVRNGYDGFLVPGNPNDMETHEFAAGLIEQLMKFPDYRQYIRRNAISAPLTWEIVAKTWEGHWGWYLDTPLKGPQSNLHFLPICPECGGEWLPLADGIHCTDCGRYQKQA